jgi:alpha-beta hydrolase superfamily lysophospholipase
MASPAEITAEMPPQVHSAADALRLGEPLADRHGYITSADGTRLFYRYWPATEKNKPIAVIVLHGIGYHSGPYKVVADALNPEGIDVYGLDARGHGLSAGTRGYVGAPARVAHDVAAMVACIRNQQPTARVFLVGDSMGCNYALDYAKDHQDELAGLVLLAPAFYVDPGQLLRPESLMVMPYFLLAHRKPVIELVGKRLEESSRDREWIATRRVDPLAYKSVSFGYLLDIQRLIMGWRSRIAPRLKVPVLMIKGGQDHVVSQKDCETFQRLCGSADKRFELYPEVAHTTLWDPQSAEILGMVGNWLLTH